MTTPIFHPLLRMIAEKAPAKKFNAKSKSGDFFHFLDQSTSIWSKDSINKFLDLIPAAEVPFAKNTSRSNKVATIGGWINKIFSENQQIAQGVVAQDDVAVEVKEFSAAEVAAAVASGNAALQKKVDMLERRLSVDKSTSKSESDKKRKSIEKAILSQQLELKKLKDALKAEMDEDDDGSDSSDDISDESEEEESKNAKKLKTSGSSKSDLGGVGVGPDTRIASNLKMFSKEQLVKLKIDFYEGMALAQLAQNIAAISLIMQQGNCITVKIENRQFFELNLLLPCTAKKEMNLVSLSREARHLRGQTKNWQVGVMDSWEKFSLALQVWVTMLAELDHELIPQVLALQNISVLFRAIDSTSVGFTQKFLPYVVNLLRSQFSESGKKLPNFGTLRPEYMPAKWQQEFFNLKRVVEQQFSVVTETSVAKKPARTVSLVSRSESDDSDDESEMAEVNADQDDDDVAVIGATSAKLPCYANQLFEKGPACKAKTCTFCNSGGKYCLVCQSTSHGAAKCLSDQFKVAQLEYFAKMLQPGGKRKLGLDPIYGGAPFKMLGYNTAEELQAAIARKSISQATYNSAARKCRKEALRLKDGGVTKREFIYPGARK